MTIITMFIESLKIISFAGKPFHWKWNILIIIKKLWASSINWNK
jgi:hypothetical protein